MTTASLNQPDNTLFSPAMSRRQREHALSSWIPAVRELEDRLAAISDDELRRHMADLRLEVLNSDATSVLPDQLQGNFICAAAFGAAAVQRTMGFQLHDVQIRGALAAANGGIIEMQTGEGKTVVCGLSALIRCVFDQSVHVATTNDYLAERDHEGVEPIFKLLGVSSAVIRLDASDDETHAAYRAQITYGPGYLFGFDYLKDQIKLKQEEQITLGRDVLITMNGRNIGDELSQFAHQTIIVDEADSVLIDESTTPLILSGGGDQEITPELTRGYLQARNVATLLTENEHYEVDRPQRQIELTDPGLDLIHEQLAEFGRLELRQPWPVYIKNALFAAHLMIRDEHYVVQDGEIKLVDQNTGRIFDDRTLRGGLHQALEASESLDINPPGRTLARVTRQRFFQLYDRVCGMTGTASGSEEELEYFYESPVVQLSPNQPNKRIELPERFFNNWTSKLVAISNDIRERRNSGQPILIGTRTIKESVMVDQALREIGIEAVILNGVQDDEEADIVKLAGQIGAITIATNMAGRGTDIKLPPESKQLGGLHVLCTQRHLSRRVDRQLAGRSARQGDPGSVQFFISADDDLFEKYGKSLAEKLIANAAENGECCKDFSGEIMRLQAKIEREQFELRRKLVRQDGWMDSIRHTIAGS